MFSKTSPTGQQSRAPFFKYLKIPKNRLKHPKISVNSQKYLKITGSILKYHKVP